MVRRCSACRKSGTKHPNETFYPFPTDPTEKARWFTLLDLNEFQIKRLPRNSVLCSDHFNSKDVITYTDGRKMIVPGAIPVFYRKRRPRSATWNALNETCTFTEESFDNKGVCLSKDTKVVYRAMCNDLANYECKVEVEDPVLHDESNVSVKREILSDEEVQMEFEPLVKVKVECDTEDIKNKEEHHDEQSSDSSKSDEPNYQTLAEIFISGINHRYQHCGFKTNDRWTLLKHIQKVHSTKYVCEYCGFTTVSSEELQKHVKRNHIKSQLLKCRLCGFSCFYAFSLKAHVETVHLLNRDEFCYFRKLSYGSKCVKIDINSK